MQRSHARRMLLSILKVHPVHTNAPNTEPIMSLDTRSMERKLAKRLFAFALIVAILLSSGAYVTLRDAIGVVVIERALIGAVRFNAQYMDLFDGNLVANRREVQTAMDEYASITASLRQRVGQFVGIRVYDLRGIEIAGTDADDFESIEPVRTLMSGSRGLSGHDTEDLHEIIRIDGVPFVRVYLPLTNSRGRVVAYVDGVFALSEESFGILRDRTFKIIIAVFMIVFTTTVLFYPIMLNLMEFASKSQDAEPAEQDGA